MAPFCFSFLAIEAARALAKSGQKLGPDIVAAVQSGSGSTIVERLVVTIFRDLALRSDLHPARA
jgi:hypothetical protein